MTTTAPAAPHGGVATKPSTTAILKDEERERDRERETQTKWETEAKWSCPRAHMENHKHK